MKTANIEKLGIIPKHAGSLFFIKLFSIIAFSVSYSTLILYLTQHLKTSDQMAVHITAAFLAYSGIVRIVGGFLSGRYFSNRILLIISLSFLTIGCILLAFPSIFYFGVTCIIMGSGLLVCINCLLTELFQSKDSDREAAFLWNYSGINIGYFIGFALSGYFQLNHNYVNLFLLSSLGSLMALYLTIVYWQHLKDRQTIYASLASSSQKNATIKGVLFLFFLFILIYALLKYVNISDNLMLIAGTLFTLFIFYLVSRESSAEIQNKLRIYLWLIIPALIFWTVYHLGPIVLTLFIERNVDRHLWNFLIAPQWLQSISNITIIIGGPLLCILLAYLRKIGINTSIAILFALALILFGFSLVILCIGVLFANSAGYIHIHWVIVSFILQACAELLLAPIGFAMIGQLAPIKLQGILMGYWLMLISIGSTLSGMLSNKFVFAYQELNLISSNLLYSHYFAFLGIFSMVSGLLLFSCQRSLRVEDRMKVHPLAIKK